MPWTNEDIVEIKAILREIQDSLKSITDRLYPTVAEIDAAREFLDNVPVPSTVSAKRKGGRPKGSKNKKVKVAKRTDNRQRRTHV